MHSVKIVPMFGAYNRLFHVFSLLYVYAMPKPKCIAFPQVKQFPAIAILRPQLQLGALHIRQELCQRVFPSDPSGIPGEAPAAWNVEGWGLSGIKHDGSNC